MADVTRFIIIFAGRTGSTYLIELLQAQPNAIAEFEKMDPLWKQGVEAQIDWMRRFYAGPFKPGVEAVGFKTKPWDLLHQDRAIEVLRECDAKVIHMTRRNLFKWALSELNAKRLYRKTGRWRSSRDDEPLGPVTLSAEEAREWIMEREDVECCVQDLVRRIGQDSMTLYYEDFAYDTMSGMRTVGEFLGCEFSVDAAERVPSRKVTPDDLRHAIANFDELLEAFRGTPVESMMLEGAPQGIGEMSESDGR